MATVSSGILSAAALFLHANIMWIIYIIRKNTCAFLLQMV